MRCNEVFSIADKDFEFYPKPGEPYKHPFKDKNINFCVRFWQQDWWEDQAAAGR
jgi:hypothetical protein